MANPECESDDPPTETVRLPEFPQFDRDFLILGPEATGPITLLDGTLTLNLLPTQNAIVFPPESITIFTDSPLPPDLAQRLEFISNRFHNSEDRCYPTSNIFTDILRAIDSPTATAHSACLALCNRKLVTHLPRNHQISLTGNRKSIILPHSTPSTPQAVTKVTPTTFWTNESPVDAGATIRYFFPALIDPRKTQSNNAAIRVAPAYFEAALNPRQLVKLVRQMPPDVVLRSLKSGSPITRSGLLNLLDYLSITPHWTQTVNNISNAAGFKTPLGLFSSQYSPATRNQLLREALKSSA